MKILLITNRQIKNSQANDETVFGERENSKGASELRFAWVDRTASGKWKVELVPEPNTLNSENLPSTSEFAKFRDQLESEKKDCVFYIPGFNSSFPISLTQAWEIRERYGVGVAVFSWPANPGGFITTEYRRAQAIARNSVMAVDRMLHRLIELVREHATEDCRCSLNMVIHSLGNYLFENFVRDPIFTNQTRIFDNIVFNAADVDSDGHMEWVRKLKFSRRIYATLNERDSILDVSDVINPDRLGNTSRNLTARRVDYVDFTGADGVRKKHRHFEGSADENPKIESFFKRVFSGQAGVPSDDFEQSAGAWRLVE